MAKNNFSLNFDGFLDYAKQLDELGTEYLVKATENALTKSKEYANQQILNAMKTSPYQFSQGREGKSGRKATGKAKKSVVEVSQKPVEWEGSICTAYVGANLKDAPEELILALGTPHIKGDTNLKNAIKVKGKYRKEMSLIQQQEFLKVIKEASENG